MALPTRVVTETWPGRAGAQVLFVLQNTVTDGTSTAQAGTQALATLDGGGNLSQALICQDPSLNAVPTYAWRPVFGDGAWVEGLVVPPGTGSVALASLSPEGPPLTPSQFTQLDDAIIAEAAARVSGDTTNAAAVTAETNRATAAEALKVAKAGDTMSGDLAMGTHRVTGLSDPATGQDAATRAWVLTQVTGSSGVTSWNGRTGAVVPTKADVGLGNVDNTADTAKPVSTATQTALNAKADLVGGFVPTAQLPALAINDTFPVASQAAMLALTAQRGDIAIRSDVGKSFVLSTDDPTTLANWLELSAAGKVTSVNAQTGVVVLAASDVGAPPTTRQVNGHPLSADVTVTKGDVGLGNADNTSDANKPVSTAQQTVINAKAPLLTPTTTKTAPYTASVNDLALMNVAGGGVTLTLPTAPADKAQVGYRAIGATTAVPLVVTAGGSDTVGLSGATTASVVYPDEITILQYQTTGTRWLAVSNVKTQASLDARYAPFTPTYHNVGNSGSAVTLPALVASVGDTFDVTLNAATPAVTLPTPVAGQSFVLRLTQDVTGSRVPSFPVTGGSTVKWSQATQPVLSTVGGKQDVLVFQSISGSAWTGGLFALDAR